MMVCMSIYESFYKAKLSFEGLECLGTIGLWKLGETFFFIL